MRFNLSLFNKYFLNEKAQDLAMSVIKYETFNFLCPINSCSKIIFSIADQNICMSLEESNRFQGADFHLS